MVVRCGMKIPSWGWLFDIMRQAASWCQTVILRRNFQFAPNSLIDSFSRILFLQQLHLISYTRYFINKYAEISTFSVKKYSVRLLPTTLFDVEKIWRKMFITSKGHPDIMHESWYKTTFHQSVTRKFLSGMQKIEDLTRVVISYEMSLWRVS